VAPYLTTASQLMCPHGGMVVPVTSNTRATAGGAPILRASDAFTIAGCPLTIGVVYHPCVTVQWVQPAARSKAVGEFALTAQSMGLCQAADQAVQGTVLVVATQPRAGGL
jgi:hypothetical protein